MFSVSFFAITLKFTKGILNKWQTPQRTLLSYTCTREVGGWKNDELKAKIKKIRGSSFSGLSFRVLVFGSQVSGLRFRVFVFGSSFSGLRSQVLIFGGLSFRNNQRQTSLALTSRPCICRLFPFFLPPRFVYISVSPNCSELASILGFNVKIGPT